MSLAAAPAACCWHDVTEWGVEGRAWPELERKRWFDRLPAQAENTVTENVWGLSRHSAGMMVRFKTDAEEIWAHYALFSDKIAMPHMAATGVSGIDLYGRDASGQWRWVGVTRPEGREVRQAIIANPASGMREYAAYLPLYNGMEWLKLGVPEGAKFERLIPRAGLPIIFYGTSITQGASASRPGMVHTAILGRRLDCPVINLGFSGNGKMDAAIGELLVRTEAGIYVIDCSPNMTADEIRQRCPPLVKMLRAAHPGTPIVLVEDRTFGNAWILPEREKSHGEKRAALREKYEMLKSEGISGLSYIPGSSLIGEDDEGTVDGSHPTDLGFMRHAAVFEPVLRRVLGA